MVSAFENRHIGTAGSVSAEDRSNVMAAALPPVLSEHIDGNVLSAALPAPASEAEVLAELEVLSAQNAKVTSLIGLGYYGTLMPSVLRRCVLENPSWYTAYTPYQPEISQGRLEALVNFQTVVADLTGMDIANASLLDEGTAVVEAMLLARRATKGRRNIFVVDDDLLPQSHAVLATRAAAVGIELVRMPLADLSTIVLPADTFGVVTQYPGASGQLWNPSGVAAAAHEVGAIAIAAADILALTLITDPASLGFDVVVGSTQRFGVPMGFGGPHAAFMGVKEKYERQLPGRLVGVSHDVDGRPAYRLALQTREQHIRRERATSNICTAQVLLAVLAGMYAVYHGPHGLRAIAERVHTRTVSLASALRAVGANVRHQAVFDTLQIVVDDADTVIAEARAADLLLWKVDETTVQFSIDETTTDATASTIAGLFSAAIDDSAVPSTIPAVLQRPVNYLQHPVFNEHHSEMSMMRYLKRLADKDYALDRGMIPLGSCTMKLNAATEMLPITWGGFANVHPFAPAEDVKGYLQLIDDLERWLAAITGYDAVSLQPNAGSQGELSGLLAIRRFHRARGDEARTVCLIPSSAHGTNAASAVLAGLSVTVVKCDDDGNVDLDDLKLKIDAAGSSLAALMITYPSTHGVFEPGVRQVCDMVHAGGGQVYIDGANLNALVGWGRFGDLGGDVSHLNLHKTFAIPHGGGGPGVGPIAAKAHLAPYLPGHPFAQQGSTTDPVAAAPFGSASVLPISWAYIRLMGAEGLRDASAAAVYAANYVSRGLADVIPTLYTEHGYVAHECILDIRPLTAHTGVTVDDVAKRLIDYGFHAPTMSFPVIGTLMVEPTESEDIAELDRFIAAMRSIVAEARDVAAERWPADDNPLVNAPHTARHLTEAWEHPYDRETAVFPQGASHSDGKYWPPVRRIDNAWGDRHLVCTCPDPAAFED